MTWLVSLSSSQSTFSIIKPVIAFEASERVQVSVIKLLLTEANFTRDSDGDRCSLSAEKGRLTLSWVYA